MNVSQFHKALVSCQMCPEDCKSQSHFCVKKIKFLTHLAENCFPRSVNNPERNMNMLFTSHILLCCVELLQRPVQEHTVNFFFSSLGIKYLLNIRASFVILVAELRCASGNTLCLGFENGVRCADITDWSVVELLRSAAPLVTDYFPCLAHMQNALTCAMLQQILLLLL